MSERPPSPEPPEPAGPPAAEGGNPAAPEGERGVLRPDVSGVSEGAPTAPGAEGPNERTPAAPEAAFDGPRGRLFRILLANLLLNVATLGVYRFWAKTRLRRFLWRHTKLLGEPLEYTGTGGELFVGFLIVMAVLAPLIGVASLAQLFVEHIAVNFIVPAVLFLLTPVALYRMWRYRFARTLWRGVQFGLDGSSLRYAGLWLGYGAATIVTLGLANPWRRVATTRYLLDRARIGATALRLDVRAGRLFVPWLVVLGLLAAVLAVLAAANFPTLHAMAAIFGDLPDLPPARAGRSFGEAVAEMHAWPLLLLLLPVIAFVRYRAVELRYFLDNLRAGGAGLRSELGTGFFVAVHLAGWAAALLIVLGVPILFVLAAAASGMEEAAVAATIIGFSIAWVILYLLLGIAYTLFVEVTVLAHVCRTLAVENPAALDDVTQSSAARPRRGEGLADALDIGGF